MGRWNKGIIKSYDSLNINPCAIKKRLWCKTPHPYFQNGRKDSDQYHFNLDFKTINMYIKLGSLVVPKWKNSVKFNERKVSKCQMYYRLCWTQNSSIFILGISQIGEFWLQRSHYS